MVKMVAGSTPNCAKGIVSSPYFPPYQLKGVAATTPSIAATSATRVMGSTPANPCEFIVTIRLWTPTEEETSSLIEKNETRIIIRKRLMEVEAIVRNDRIGLRLALRKMYLRNFMMRPQSGTL